MTRRLAIAALAVALAATACSGGDDDAGSRSPGTDEDLAIDVLLAGRVAIDAIAVERAAAEPRRADAREITDNAIDQLRSAADGGLEDVTADIAAARDDVDSPELFDPVVGSVLDVMRAEALAVDDPSAMAGAELFVDGMARYDILVQISTSLGQALIAPQDTAAEVSHLASLATQLDDLNETIAADADGTAFEAAAQEAAAALDATGFRDIVWQALDTSALIVAIDDFGAAREQALDAVSTFVDDVGSTLRSQD